MSLLAKLVGELRSKRTESQPGLREIFMRAHGIHKWRHYFEIYERFLERFRGQPVTMLEIGVGEGGSLAMWEEYLGPSAVICGMDVNPDAARLARGDRRIFIGDQADAGFLRRVRDELGAVDVVLDDGGHTMSQQVTTFEALYPITRHLYVVEDTHTSYSPDFQDRPEGTFIEYAKDRIDALYEWYRSPGGYRQYRVPQEAARPVEVSEFCSTTLGVHFYDSVVVFEKGAKSPPVSERR
ncbi:MAG TPA: hypothetical protein VHP37_30685 [Burkholderiales bacterium]|nr:hypothetical protein [Burkholderiales bacterium]